MVFDGRGNISNIFTPRNNSVAICLAVTSFLVFIPCIATHPKHTGAAYIALCVYIVIDRAFALICYFLYFNLEERLRMFTIREYKLS